MARKKATRKRTGRKKTAHTKVTRKKAAGKKATRKTAAPRKSKRAAPKRRSAARVGTTARRGAAKKKIAKRKPAPRKAAKRKAVKKKAVAKKKAAVRKAAPKKTPPRPPARQKEAASKSAAARKAEEVRQRLSRAKVGTFQDLFGTCPPEVQSIAHRLRELIFELIPDAQETVYLGWRIALYKKATEICGIQPAGDRCNFYLTKGAYLHDPHGLLEGTGKSIRHVKVRSVVGMSAEAIRDLLRQALEITGP